MRGLTGDLGRRLRTAAGLLGLGAASLCAPTLPVMAQDVSRIAPPIDGRPVHKQKTPRGPVFPRAPTIDRAQPLYLQGDELIYDNAGSRVTARGNVEIYYANYILTADEVIYDQGAN